MELQEGCIMWMGGGEWSCRKGVSCGCLEMTGIDDMICIIFAHSVYLFNH